MKNHLAKKLSLSLCAALTLSGVAAAHAQSMKVGVVDMNRVFTGYYKTKDAEEKINTSRNQSKKELDDRLDTHKQMLDEINALSKDLESSALSASAKTEKQKKREDKVTQIRSLEQSINEFKASREKQLQEQAVRTRNTLVEDIMVVVSAKVKSDNYDLVIDKSGQSLNGVQIVLTSAPKLEFTDEIITSLNKNKPAAAAADPVKAAPSATPKK